MGGLDDRTPVLVGAGQVTLREPEPGVDAVELMVRASRAAAADAGAGERLLATIDTIAVPNVLCWPYVNPARLVAERLGVAARREIYTTIGGNTPQMLVDVLATRIARGEVGTALITGAEAIRSVRRAIASGAALDWPRGDGAPERLGDDRDGSSDLERAHGLAMPVEIYPLFENAYRAVRGWTIAEHRDRLGRLCSRLAVTAAGHPHAWTRRALAPDEIVTPSPDNRMVAFPYPKRMTANIDVDQGAAVVMTSAATARALGIPAARWVHLHGAAEAHDVWLVSERAELARSPAIAACTRAALAMAGLEASRLARFDLYSCFPCAVEIAAHELGLADDDPRPLSVTGGLPYFGGPGNDYALHGIATMMDALRADPGSYGLVTALGWYMTKHAAGVYGTAPPAAPWTGPATDAVQHEVDRVRGVPVVREPDGAGTVESYTIAYGRDGACERGTVLGRLDDGRRFLARLPADRTLLEALTRSEGVGLRGRVASENGLARFEPA
ncbi:MAG TPA: acetyl-CoA acetyltransferase [Candidatus Limnocylindria bacterium]|nr:acetyl-CoA acetyltransferase [Candidatus Limnocylindria bacterium]